MKIGRLPPQNIGEQVELNKWYFGIEILKCPPTQIGIFRPYIFFIFVKFKQFGEPYIYGGKKEIKIGGWKFWECPFGIKFNIIRFK